MLVQPLKANPPGELLRCASRPEGFTAEAWAIIPPDVREKLIEILTAFGGNADLLDRNVNYHVPGKCHPPDS